MESVDDQAANLAPLLQGGLVQVVEDGGLEFGRQWTAYSRPAVLEEPGVGRICVFRFVQWFAGSHAFPPDVLLFGKLAPGRIALVVRNGADNDRRAFFECRVIAFDPIQGAKRTTGGGVKATLPQLRHQGVGPVLALEFVAALMGAVVRAAVGVVREETSDRNELAEQVELMPARFLVGYLVWGN